MTTPISRDTSAQHLKVTAWGVWLLMWDTPCAAIEFLPVYELELPGPGSGTTMEVSG